jgi:hypothetical protein
MRNPGAVGSSIRYELSATLAISGWPPTMRTGGARLTSRPPCGTAAHARGRLPGLLIAAVAERERVAVLHYDGDYELIAQVAGHPLQWVVPCRTVP